MNRMKDPRIGSTRSRSGEGRAFAVDGEQVAVFRLRDGALRALAGSARTGAARWPTA